MGVLPRPGGKGPDGTSDSFEIVHRQPRGVVLGSPRVLVFWKKSRDPKVEALVDAILEAHGLTVDRGVWED